MSIFATMIDERMFDLLRSQLAAANQEKRWLYDEIKSLHEEVYQLRLSMDSSGNHLSGLISEIGSLKKELLKRDKKISNLETKLLNAQSKLADVRGKRYGRTSEQVNLLNNRNPDSRGEEKSNYDGTPDSLPKASPTGQDDMPDKEKAPKKEKDSEPRSPKESYKVDESILHRLADYYQLPAGARLMRRQGEIDICLYKQVEIIPARVIEHIYEVARVQYADGTFGNTMDMPYVVGKCPFSSRMLAEILCWKYIYNMSANKVRRRLANAGAYFSKSTLNRYMHMGMRGLRLSFEELFKRETQQTDYLMIDETCALVGLVKNGVKVFRKKYIWTFYDHLKKMVYYLYEEGSRARKVVTGFLETFCGFISTDGYVGYSVFDASQAYPEIVRCGCWTHARRLFVDALPGDRRSLDVINEMGRLFAVETQCSLGELDEGARKIKREKESVPILARLYACVKTLSRDTVTMSNDLMRKAVNYTLNQWDNLNNFIKAGKVQLSNNLCEQRMKPVKLTLKVCQNIGSEVAAENSAFLFSLTESCNLNGIRPEGYLEKLLDTLHLQEQDRKSLLPCYYKQ